MGSPPPTLGSLAALVTLAALSPLFSSGPAIADRADHGARRAAHKVWPPAVYPPPAAVRRTQRFAAARGDVSFAVLDRSLGLRGYDQDRQFSSASVSKALLLAAELRRLDREGLPLDGATRALLEPMITYSDNGAADAVYARVGDEGLDEVAERAGMGDFEPTPGFWGGDQITAADMARFFYRLDANLPRRHRAYGKRLLARTGGEHNSGPVTHQAALLEHRRGERLALAVLTGEAPWGGGFETIEGVARRLLKKPPPHRGGWLAP
jgi:beta-lactamase class A